MDPANLRLSPTEMDLVLNADWILTKNEIVNKAKGLLAILGHDQQKYLTTVNCHLPAEVIKSSPKISKGENYKGLPYLVLDYPRVFDQENVFTIRSLFWWGNFFSLTLQLSGDYKKMYTERIAERSARWKENDFYYCINEDPWQHDFGKENYRPVNMDFADFIRTHPFIKLGKVYPLKNWEESIKNIKADYELICGLITL